jgi:Zn-dependent metalloprotease
MRFLLLCRSLFFLICLLLASTVSFSQQLPAHTKSFKRSPDGRYNFIKLGKSPAGQRINPSEATIKSMLGLGNNHALLAEPGLMSGLLKNDGQIKHTRFQQYFQNIKVEFGIITAHSKNNDLEIISGEYFQVPENLPLIPVISESTALSYAMNFMGASEYSWQTKDFLHSEFSKKPSGELVICRDFFANTSTSPVMRLAFKFSLYATKPLRYEQVYVDAHTGKILLNNPVIKHVDGTAATRYSGNRTISTTFRSGNYSLRDTSGIYNIVTWNMNRGTSYTAATEFTDNDNNWTQQEFDNSNFDNAALDAHWATMMTYDYFRIKHNRNSYDNNGARLNSYVHYGNGYVNAFWNGVAMTYGDGNGSTSFPLTTLDICGHEIAHALCEYSAGLIYMNESGAVNESLSDIWGACVEKFAAPEKNTWLLGEEFSSTGTPIRSLVNPKNHNQPDTYKGINWYTGSGDNGGVHFNSGVMNHWFYILSEGKSGTNDFGLSYNIAGIGIEKAAAITYRTEVLYLFPGAVYADARVGSIQAALDLYGENSNEYNQVVAAWNAVGVYESVLVPQSVVATSFGFSMIAVTWSFSNAQTVNAFVIERAVNASNNYVVIKTIPGSERSFIDSGFVRDAVNKYRIRALKGGVYSGYSNVASASIGAGPFIMKQGVYSICGRLFLDPGAYEKYNSQSSTITTLLPSFAGGKVRVSFSKFQTVPGWDLLRVYNGPNTSYPLIGQYSGYVLPPTIESTAPGGELTFYFSPFSGSGDSGWVASITCFKPVAAPTGLSVTLNPENKAALTWTDNADDETSFVIERSVNDSSNFSSYAILGPNSNSFLDQGVTDKSIFFYRVFARRDTVVSKLSNMAAAYIGNNFYPMQTGTVNTCSMMLMDPGGVGYYSNYLNTSTTIRPAEAGKKIRVAFSDFRLASCCDYLQIYDGPNTSSPLLGSFGGSTLPPGFISTASDGELTFVFYSDYTGTNAGFLASIDCVTPVSPPAGVTANQVNQYVSVNWMDNSNDETKFVIERSVNTAYAFTFLANAGPNTTNFIDSTAPANCVLYYRLRAFRDSIPSTYSNAALVNLGNIPFFMKDSTLITCEKVFMDEGGASNYPISYSVKTATFVSSVAGNQLRVVFSQLKLGYSSSLTIYNGPTTSAPIIGFFNSGSPIPAPIQSSSPDGSITFRFIGQGSTDSGWVVQLQCFSPVQKPSGLTSIVLDSTRVRLNWIDNSPDETNFIVERSVNATSLFEYVASVAPNSSFFIDSTVPANSVVFYRIRAIRDVYLSFYSDTSVVYLGNAPFLMKDSILITCDKIFYDPGGKGSFNAQSYYRTTTFRPPLPGHRITARFLKFDLSSTALSVYNGPSTSSPLIGSFSGRSLPPLLTGTGIDGSLTFYLYPYSGADPGWEAQISCYRIPDKPTNVSAALNTSQLVAINWTDNSNDETRFVIERSVNGPGLFTILKEIPANTTNFVDSSAPANAVLYYRLTAFRDTVRSFLSDTARLFFGNAPYLESATDTTIISCDKFFMAPGGRGLSAYSGLSYKTTFKPAQPGYFIKATYVKNGMPANNISVYNGSTVDQLQRIAYYGSISGPIHELISSTNDGALTFVHETYSCRVDSGFVFKIFCVRPQGSPGNLYARLSNSNHVQVTWQDNSTDERAFVVERSIGDTTNFIPLASLDANIVSFTDSSAPPYAVVFYRVYAVLDYQRTDHSNKGIAQLGGASVNMSTGTLYTCDATFYDPGGPAGFYPGSTNIMMTFAPPVPGNKMRVVFSMFKFHFFVRGDDTLKVYNGPSINSPLLGVFTGPFAPPILESTAPGGELTFVFKTDLFGSDSGWAARIYCIPPTTPANFDAVRLTSGNIRLSWNDPNSNEDGVQIERSVGDSLQFVRITELAADSTQFVDTTASINRINYYRIRAYNNPFASAFSNLAAISPVVCATPVQISTNSSITNFFISGPTAITDLNCGLVAHISPQGAIPIHGTIASSLWIDSIPSAAYGLHFVAKRYQLVPEVEPGRATGVLSMYSPQSAFNSYNQITRHSKLPTGPNDSSGIQNIRVFLSKGKSGTGSGAINSYPGYPEEVEWSSTNIAWNNVLGCWIVSIPINGSSGVFISSRSDTISICKPTNNTEVLSIKSNRPGMTHQWQRFNGVAFENIFDNDSFQGTDSFVVQVKTSSLTSADKFRCIVDGVPTEETTVIMRYFWEGSWGVDWNDARNWRCGSIPDASTDVIIESGKANYPIIRSNVDCRSLTVKAGARVDVENGFKITIHK